MADFEMFIPTRILSSTTTGDLLEGIDRSLANGAKKILVNLQNVLFMDSTGLSALVIAYKRVRAANGRFALCSLNGQARMLIEQTGMEKLFEIYETPEEFGHSSSAGSGSA
jgi:anti-anti-sigma factor